MFTFALPNRYNFLLRRFLPILLRLRERNPQIISTHDVIALEHARRFVSLIRMATA